MKIEFYALTDVGKKREHNEDCYFADSKEIAPGFEVGILIVADGVGGVEKGEIASFIACKNIGQYLKENIVDGDILSMETRAKVTTAITEANKAIREVAQRTGVSGGMGTTLVMALITEKQLLVANVGDSRAYHLFGQLSQITKDHSYVQELVDAGQLAKEDMEKHPQRNVITRCLGLRNDVEVDFFPYELATEDPFILLCSDGLYTMVEPGTVLSNENMALPLDALCKTMVDAANNGGGSDNITILLARPKRKMYGTPRPPVMPREIPAELITRPGRPEKVPGEGTGAYFGTKTPVKKSKMSGKVIALISIVVAILLITSVMMVYHLVITPSPGLQPLRIGVVNKTLDLSGSWDGSNYGIISREFNITNPNNVGTLLNLSWSMDWLSIKQGKKGSEQPIPQTGSSLDLEHKDKIRFVVEVNLSKIPLNNDKKTNGLKFTRNNLSLDGIIYINTTGLKKNSYSLKVIGKILYDLRSLIINNGQSSITIHSSWDGISSGIKSANLTILNPNNVTTSLNLTWSSPWLSLNWSPPQMATKIKWNVTTAIIGPGKKLQFEIEADLNKINLANINSPGYPNMNNGNLTFNKPMKISWSGSNRSEQALMVIGNINYMINVAKMNKDNKIISNQEIDFFYNSTEFNASSGPILRLRLNSSFNNSFALDYNANLKLYIDNESIFDGLSLLENKDGTLVESDFKEIKINYICLSLLWNSSKDIINGQLTVTYNISKNSKIPKGAMAAPPASLLNVIIHIKSPLRIRNSTENDKRETDLNSLDRTIDYSVSTDNTRTLIIEDLTHFKINMTITIDSFTLLNISVYADGNQSNWESHSIEFGRELKFNFTSKSGVTPPGDLIATFNYKIFIPIPGKSTQSISKSFFIDIHLIP